jgi:hypothetical protein
LGRAGVRQHDEAGPPGMKRVNDVQDAVGRAPQRADLLSAGYRCSGRGAIFDVRTLRTPPLGAERMARLSTRMGFRAEMLG